MKLSEILQGISVFLGNFMGKKTLNKEHHYSISLKNKTQQWSTFLLILLSIFLKYPHFVLMISFILMISSSLHAICSIIYVWERPTYASDGDQTSWDIYLSDKLKSPFICFNLKNSNFLTVRQPYLQQSSQKSSYESTDSATRLVSHKREVIWLLDVVFFCRKI